MTIGQKQLHINGITWHCLSIFYARKNQGVLLKAINDFCKTNRKYINHWSIYFSKEQGERINLVLISEKQYSEKLSIQIEDYFEQFLKENSSENLSPIPYGSILWIPYPNNSLVWNVFQIPHFLFNNQEIRYFVQLTSLLIINLYDEESSYEENVATISMFLYVKLLKKQNESIPYTYNSELAETLQSYWDYEENSLLSKWMQFAIPALWPFSLHSHLDLSGHVFPVLRKTPTVSFCITCKNRFHQISQTLRKNLDDNRLHMNSVEFVLVDFGSTDGLRDWVMDNFQEELEKNYLRYYYTDELPDWHCSIAKNTSHLLAKNTILVNLDCDNFTGNNGGQFIAQQWMKHGEQIVLHQFDNDLWGGSYGRIAVDRDSFRRVGGYDESFEPVAMQDEDLIKRLTGYGLKYVCVSNKKYNRAIKNSKEETVANVHSDLNYEEMVIKNRAISEKNVKAGNWTVNNGQWGIRRNIYDINGKLFFLDNTLME